MILFIIRISVVDVFSLLWTFFTKNLASCAVQRLDVSSLSAGGSIGISSPSATCRPCIRKRCCMLTCVFLHVDIRFLHVTHQTCMFGKMQVSMLATLNSMFDTSTCMLRVLHVENFCMLQVTDVNIQKMEHAFICNIRV